MATATRGAPAPSSHPKLIEVMTRLNARCINQGWVAGSRIELWAVGPAVVVVQLFDAGGVMHYLPSRVGNSWDEMEAELAALKEPQA
jgi:hypothetical protein